jgi:ATPase subunit of ABC transporter with duplicated ATPase domains
MPAAIVLTNLGWSLPDGRTLFSGLDLAFGPERTGLVGRNGVGKTTLLKLISGELSPGAGQVAVRGKLAVLRQIVRPAEAETVADLFGVTDALAVLVRAETGQASEDDLAAADWTLEARMAGALADLGLAVEPQTWLAALSGGQRTRAALAALVFAAPDVLILDEPTNNLDRDGRRAVIDLLAGWRAAALVVSHDRELLETMDAIVELSTHGARRYGGGFSLYRERKALELAAAEQDLAEAERRKAELAGAAQQRAERKARKDGAGRRAAARGDQPRIVLGMRKDRAEDSGGGEARLAERQRAEADARAAAARARIEVLAPLTVALPSTGLAAGKEVLKLDGVVAGYDPATPVLRGVSFAVAGPERVAITGPNGAGKSTLLAVIAGQLAPQAGTVRRPTHAALLDQTMSLLDPATSILANFRRLNPEAGDNAAHAALARFMFRAEAALRPAGALSGGEQLRAGLACVLGGPAPPPLLLLDEPTNHLDLASLEAVEAGLSAYDGALIVVSHDEAFLTAIGVSRRIAMDADLGRSHKSGERGR